MENHSTFDPFKIFSLEYEFEIENLETRYFALLKKSENKDEINQAYQFLKDPIKRAIFLANFYGFSKADHFIAKEMLSIFSSREISEELLQILEAEIIANAINRDWHTVWITAQKHSYVNRFLLMKKSENNTHDFRTSKN